MKFLVDLYRYVIFGLCGLILIGLTFATVSGFGSEVFNATIGPIWILGVIVVLMLLILSVGTVAVVISIHDRHVEAANSLERIADVLEWERQDRITAARE